MSRYGKKPGGSSRVAQRYGDVPRTTAPGKVSAVQRMVSGRSRIPSTNLGASRVQEQRTPASNRSGLISTHALAANLSQARANSPSSGNGQLKFRVPTASAIKALLVSKSVPEDKVKESIATALTRMSKEKTSALSTNESIPAIMKKLFPSKGVFDEASFKKIVNVNNRSKIYQDINDTNTKPNSTDKPKLIAAMNDAIKLLDKARGDRKGLIQVFGRAWYARARRVYRKAKTAMIRSKASIDTAISTDYNRDDEQIAAGGWAAHASQHVHLTRKVAGVANKSKSIITLIHEFCHLALSSVDDHGYYGSSGFVGMSPSLKAANAAHYEELPRRYLGTSKFASITFQRGRSKGGGSMTFEDHVRREANEYLRKAWDTALHAHVFLREVRQKIDAGSTAEFTAKKARILGLSKLEKLTIHHQTPPTTINLNDIVLAEGVARAAAIIMVSSKNVAVPAAPVPPKNKSDYVKEVVTKTIANYGALTGNAADDKKLMDWLVANYRQGF